MLPRSLTDSRLVVAVAGLLASLAVSAVAWIAVDVVLLLLVVPFVPFLFSRRADAPPVRECPACDFRTRDPEFTHCPRDGTELE